MVDDAAAAEGNVPATTTATTSTTTTTTTTTTTNNDDDKKKATTAAWSDLHAILIDEAQFFPNLVSFVSYAADVCGKHVVVAGLSGDYRRRPFGEVMQLVPLADAWQMIHATCHTCQAPAIFTVRLDEREGEGEGVVQVGGEDLYQVRRGADG